MMRKGPIAALLTAALAAADAAPARAEGLSISKVGTYLDDSIGDYRFDAIVCRIDWDVFQPTSTNDAVVTELELCIDAGADENKKSILQINFMPSDVGVNQTNMPTWAKNAGARTVSDPNQTNIFPVYWDPIYKGFVKNAILKLMGIYNSDARVAGYHSTGFSGVLPTSLAGEQTDALCDDYRAEGLTTGDCDYNMQSQTIASGSPYGLVVREMLAFWAQNTSKPVVYNTRTLDPFSLALELEANPVGLYPNLAVIDNGFRDCAGLLASDTMDRFQGLQAAGHVVGWWSISINGFPKDVNGNILPGLLAEAIQCAVDNLDVQKMWFALSSSTWIQYPDAIDTLYYAIHEDQIPPTPDPPTGVAVQ